MFACGDKKATQSGIRRRGYPIHHVTMHFCLPCRPVDDSERGQAPGTLPTMTQQIRWLLAGVSKRFQGPQALFILMSTYGVIGTKSQEDSVAVRPDLQVSRVAGRRQAALTEVITEREDEGGGC